MRINWVLAENTLLDHDVDIEELKNIGSFWGSWKTWRGCSTDNVICSDVGQARSLIQRNFNQMCNLYVPETSYVELDRPTGVKLYGGMFNFEIDFPDDLISMHLAASQSDIILLLGFDCQPKDQLVDRLQEHRAQNYRTGIKHAIKDNPEVQWVLIDHPDNLMDEVKDLPNLTVDRLPNVIDMLGS